MRSLHVLAFSRSLPFHGIGGMQAIAWDVLRGMAAAGHRVTVITAAIAGQPRRFGSEGVEVVPLAGTRHERYGSAWWRASDEAALAVHHVDPVDAVLSVSVAAAEVPRFRAAAPHVPFLLQAHGTSWGEVQSKWRSGRLLQRLKSVKNLLWLVKDAFIYRRFDEIVLVGETLQAQFERWPMTWVAHGVPRVFIRNGVDTARFRYAAAEADAVRESLGLAPEHRLVIFVARLHPQKGARQLLAAFERVLAQMPHARLLFVGGGEDEPLLRKEVAEHRLERSVFFTGSVDRALIPAYLSGADAFAFPSLRVEVGLPMNVLEALACGLPCVVSKSMQMALPSQATIDYVEPHDLEQLASAIVRALAGARVRQQLLDDRYALSRCVAAYVERLSMPA